MAAPDESCPPAKGKELLFAMEIVDGFTFRGLIEILHNLNTEDVFVFTKRNCVCVNSDDKRNIIIKIVIEKRQMISYKFAPEKEDDIVSVNIPMTKFKDALKSVTKRDNLMLYQYFGDSNLYIGRSDNEDEQYITTLEGGSIQSFEEPVYCAGADSPSYVIATEELSRKFSTIGRGSGNGAEGRITISDDSEALQVNVEGSQGLGSRVKINKTQSDAPRLKKPQVFQLSRGIVKLLSKIQALYKGPVQFYTEDNLPLKITCNVGTYGTLTAYISNITEKWEAEKREEQELKPVSTSAVKFPESRPEPPQSPPIQAPVQAVEDESRDKKTKPTPVKKNPRRPSKGGVR